MEISEAIITKKGYLDDEIYIAKLYKYFMRAYNMGKQQIDELDWREAVILKELDRAERIEWELSKNG